MIEPAFGALQPKDWLAVYEVRPSAELIVPKAVLEADDAASDAVCYEGFASLRTVGRRDLDRIARLDTLLASHVLRDPDEIFRMYRA